MIIETLLNWVNSLSQNEITLIYLGCMIVISFAIYLATHNFLVALISVESLPAMNLAIIVTEPWLQLGTKPLLPLWITLILLAIPFMILLFRLFSLKDNKSEVSKP